MQKLVRIFNPSSSDIDNINITYLNKGWDIIKMLDVNSTLILLLEKVTRKEKLEKLDEL